MDNEKESSILGNLLQREISGSSLSRRSNPFGKFTPERLCMPMESVLPTIALQNGHIFLGFTDCGRFLLSYSIQEEYENGYNRNELTFAYKLYIWIFIPYKLAKRVASIQLFSNAGIPDNNLLIDVSQWRNDDSRLIITGTSCSPETGGCRSLCYVTLTTLPSTSFCAKCSFQKLLPEFDEPCHADGVFLKARCLDHSLTTHLVYERVPPFPKFNFDLQLKWNNSIVLNSANALHIFTYNISGPQKESAFSSELLIPPLHHEPRTSKTRLLRCGFWFLLKSGSNCLQKILSNTTSREASRILTVVNNNKAELEENEICISSQVSFLSSVPYSMDFASIAVETQTHRRRLSQSSVDSEMSTLSSVSRSTLFSQSSTFDVNDVEFKSVPSPPKRAVCRSGGGHTGGGGSMPPPQRRRKFFKTSPNLSSANSRKDNSDSSASTIRLPPEQSYDIFDVGVEEVLLERSLSSYRKRRNADKQYEFSDPDASTENLVPLKLSRNRQRRQGGTNVNVTMGLRSPRSNENMSSGESSRCEAANLGPGGYPRSPRSILVHSPAMSPNYLSEVGDILRPLSNNSFRSNFTTSPLHPLFSPPAQREFCDDYSEAKIFSKFTAQIPPGASGSFDSESLRNDRPMFSTKLNCIAKILRSYVDKEDDNLSVKTDTDDEYSQTMPFPVALNLDVHGTQYQPLQLINNSKIKSSLAPVVEILQRTLEIEILCNEVAGMICLSADKSFISCFDYDVAILDVCPEKGAVTALAVILFTASATSICKSPRSGDGIYESSQHATLFQDLRQKYEAIFSFVWEPVEENCRILYMGHLREIDTIPERWQPTKQILQGLETRLPGKTSSNQRVLTNKLAVYEWQSLDELVDATGLITLRSTNSSARATPGSVSALNFCSLSNIDTEDEDLSD